MRDGKSESEQLQRQIDLANSLTGAEGINVFAMMRFEFENGKRYAACNLHYNQLHGTVFCHTFGT